MNVIKTLINTIRYMSVKTEPHVVYLETLSHMIKGDEHNNIGYVMYWRAFVHDHMLYLPRPDIARLWVSHGMPESPGRGTR